MDDPVPMLLDDDPEFERICLRYGLPVNQGRHLARNDLSRWSSHDISAVLDKVDGLPSTSDNFERPYFFQAQDWIKPPASLVERAAEQKLALCISASGHWKLLENGYLAISHVWQEGLYADPKNRGLPRVVIKQLFAMVQSLNIEWIWLDSLVVPGGRRALTLQEEFTKIKLINNMSAIYRRAITVVILDMLLLRLQSRDPIDIGITILFGRWMSRVWTFQEAKLASRAMILTATGFIDCRRLVRQLQGKNDREGAKIHQLHASLSRLLKLEASSATSLMDIALSCAYRFAHLDVDYVRGFFPCLGLDWNEKFTRDTGMQHIMRSFKDQAAQLLGMNGSPLLVDGYGWAPAFFRGLQGTLISDIIWEDRGLRKAWYTYGVTQREDRHLFEIDKSGTLVLDLADPEGSILCKCTFNPWERPEAINGFKTAMKHGKAFLLCDISFETFMSNRGERPLPTVLMVREADTTNEAFIFMTAALVMLSRAAVVSRKSWLIYHQSPLGEKSDSDFRDLPATTAIKDPTVSHQGESSLHIAVRSRQDAALRRIVSEKCEVDNRNPAGWTPLHVASHLGSASAIQILLSAGASTSCLEKCNNLTPLQLAIGEHNDDSVAALIVGKADVNEAAQDTLAPLILAVKSGSLGSIQQLVEAGARVDAICQLNSRNSLHEAVEARNAAALKLLLESPQAENALYRKDCNGESVIKSAWNTLDGDLFALTLRYTWYGRFAKRLVLCIGLIWLGLVLLFLSIPLALVLDVFFLLWTGQRELLIGSYLSGLWIRYETPIRYAFWITLALSTRKVIPFLLIMRSLLRIHPQDFHKMQVIEPFKWTKDTFFFSRLIPLLTLLWKVGWILTKNCGPFVLSVFITGGVFRFYRDNLYGRPSSEAIRATEAGDPKVAVLTICFTGSFFTVMISSIIDACQVLGRILELAAWKVMLQLVIIFTYGTIATLWIRPHLIGGLAHQRLKRHLPMASIIRAALLHGAQFWFSVLLARFQWQGKLRSGEILLAHMTGLNKFHICLVRLTLTFAFGRIFAVFFREYINGTDLHSRQVDIEQSGGWTFFFLKTLWLGIVCYCPIVAILTMASKLYNHEFGIGSHFYGLYLVTKEVGKFRMFKSLFASGVGLVILAGQLPSAERFLRLITK